MRVFSSRRTPESFEPWVEADMLFKLASNRGRTGTRGQSELIRNLDNPPGDTRARVGACLTDE